MDLKTPAFIGDPASIRKLALSPLRLLIALMFPVYVNYTLRVNYLYLLG